MPEDLQIEVDGEPIEHSARSGRAAPKWGFPAAIAVVGALAIAVVAAVAIPRLTTELESRSVDANEASTAGASSETMPPLADERAAAVEAALADWGRFAVSGDTDVLADTFDPGGPQFRRLADQASAISAAPPGPPTYTVTMASAAVQETAANEAVVSGTVVWSRQGEVDQEYRWEIVLRRSGGGRWLVWTVRSRT
jgi:hypothetical protein